MESSEHERRHRDDEEDKLEELERRVARIERTVKRLMTLEEDTKAAFDAFAADVSQHLDLDEQAIATLQAAVAGNAAATQALADIQANIANAKAALDARPDPTQPPPAPTP